MDVRARRMDRIRRLVEKRKDMGYPIQKSLQGPRDEYGRYASELKGLARIQNRSPTSFPNTRSFLSDWTTVTPGDPFIVQINDNLQ